jgi:hypothetical protein
LEETSVPAFFGTFGKAHSDTPIFTLFSIHGNEHFLKRLIEDLPSRNSYSRLCLESFAARDSVPEISQSNIVAAFYLAQLELNQSEFCGGASPIDR